VYLVAPVPANRLSAAERERVVTVLDSPRFVDQPPLQVYAQLLDEDTYLCSVSSMYRILGEHRQVRERRRLARHPARVRPELVDTAPGQVYLWDIDKLAGPVKGTYFGLSCLSDDRHLLPLHRRSRRPRPRVGPAGGRDSKETWVSMGSHRSSTPTGAPR
jgi:putative transposase